MEVARDGAYRKSPNLLLLGMRLTSAFNHATGRYLSMPQRLKGGFGITFALYHTVCQKDSHLLSFLEYPRVGH